MTSMRLAPSDPRLISLICLGTLLLHLVLFWERSVLSLQTGSQQSGKARQLSLQRDYSPTEAKVLAKALHDINAIVGTISLDPNNRQEVYDGLQKISGRASEALGGVASRAWLNMDREEEAGKANAQAQADVGKMPPAATATLEEKLSSLVENMEKETDDDLGLSRKKIKLFVGVFSGFNDPGRKEKGVDKDRYNYQKRRQALRETWFPGSKEERSRLEEKGIIVRFVIGHTDDKEEEERMDKEGQEIGDLMRLPIKESYYSLTNKTKTFFAAASMTYDADWVVKVDDDVYLMVERILLAAAQWDKMGAGYIGCMKHGYVWKEEKSRWFEPNHLLLGQEYYLHAYGSIYALSQSTIKNVIVRNFNNLRYLSNEDTTVGAWMLGHNITHFEDMRLCATRCSDAAIGILKNECAGLCNPLKDLYLVHNAQSCKSRPNGTLEYLPSYPDHTAFESMRV